MESNNQFLREVRSEVRKEKIINFLSTYKKHILLTIILIVVLVSGYFAYDAYINSKAEKNSVLFYQAKEQIQKNNSNQAIVILDSLIKDGTNGYQFVSSLEKVKILISQNKVNDAVSVLNSMQDISGIPSYYKSMLRSINFIVRMNSADLDKDKTLISDINSSLDKNDNYYFINLEMYAALLVKSRDYKGALSKYNEISSSDKASQAIRDRARRMESLLTGYLS